MVDTHKGGVRGFRIDVLLVAANQSRELVSGTDTNIKNDSHVVRSESRYGNELRGESGGCGQESDQQVHYGAGVSEKSNRGERSGEAT